ncbi:MAG: PhzF family phenazine biosynthesis protein [Vicinamibacterales bacterium]
MTHVDRRTLNRTVAGSLAFALTRSTDASASTSQAGRSARRYRYLLYDVFTNRPLTGNQLAVFMAPTGLDTETMAAMTREMNFSESTFVFPKEDPKTDVRVRIFGRAGEMPFAGHPTIGTTFALAHSGAVKPGQARLVVGLGVGPTPVDLEWRGRELSFAWMNQLQPTFGPTVEDLSGLSQAIGLETSVVRAVGKSPQEVSCGSAFLFVALPSREAVDGAVVDARALDHVFQKAGVRARGIFVFSPEKGRDDVAAYSRMLGAGGAEDAATGSATGPLGCYLVRQGLVSPEQATHMVSLQGFKMRRPSRLHIDIATKGGEITGVRVGGESVLVGEGMLVAG